MIFWLGARVNRKGLNGLKRLIGLNEEVVK
jgi:hypothetical protein